MEAAIKLFLNEENRGFLGKGRVELLKLIDKYGSISRAAKELGMSYKRAWESIKAMNEIAKEPLILTQTGGKRGGGSRLTPYAKELIDRYEKMEITLKNATAQQLPKISARNKIEVIIKKIKIKKSEVVVTGEFEDSKLKAIITPEAMQELDLQKGEMAYFLFKAGATTKGDENCLKGKLLERIDDKRIKVAVGRQIMYIKDRFKVKGYTIHFCIDPEEIMILKV